MELKTISPLAWALCAALAMAGVQTVRLDAARARGVREALVADSVAAAKDTTRVVELRGLSGGALADSLRVVQRRALQVGQRADALDRALGLERVVREQLETTVRELRETAVAETVKGATDDSVRRAVFDVRQEPYTVAAMVELPKPPEQGRMNLVVALDTLRLDVRIGCGNGTTGGVRPASVSVAGPEWAGLRLGRVEQAAEVCGRGALVRRSGTWSVLSSIAGRFGLTVGYVAARAGSGAVTAGPGVGVGFRVWP